MITYQTYIKRERYRGLYKDCVTFPDGSRQVGSWEVPQDIEAHTIYSFNSYRFPTFRGNGIVYLPQILGRNKLRFASIL